MAAENTEPKSGIILQIALLAVVVLVAARFGLVSYFNQQMDEEYQRKVATKGNGALEKLHQEEQKALTGGPLPIDKAIALMASKPRESLGEKIAPQQSNDTAAVVGWGQTPRALSAAAAHASEDAGAPVADGAAPLATGDAAAPAHDAAAPVADAGRKAPAADAGRSPALNPSPPPGGAPKDHP